MYPPLQGTPLSIEAISGICGSVSIACWIVVFSPQIAENFRSQAEGLSTVFIVIWSLGDVFNVVGGVMQRVLPTMIILAIYYLLVDVVLLGQCFYYKGITLKNTNKKTGRSGHSGDSDPEERSALLEEAPTDDLVRSGLQRNASESSFHERLFPVDGTHLSPATPLRTNATMGTPTPTPTRRLFLHSLLINSFVVVLVISAGILGWFLGHRNAAEPDPGEDKDALEFNFLGQIFGYICSVLYLGSRVPQLLLNHRRKSTDGISMLFFLFACIGNLTYNMSIFAYAPQFACNVPLHCEVGEAACIYWKHITVNLSWIIGSLGTLLLDLGVFVQYFMYNK